MDENSFQDIQLLNVLINNKKELRDFLSHSNEDLFVSSLKRFAKHLFAYFHAYNSCPSKSTLLEFATAGTNSNLEDYITDVWESIDDNYTDPREYSFVLKKLKTRKNFELLEQAKKIIDNSLNNDDPNVLLSTNNSVAKIVGEIKSIGEKRVYSEGSLKDEVEAYVERFKAKQNSPELSQGLMTGFSILDYYTNGLRPAELGIIAADTGGGKSIFLINLAVNVWMGKNKLPESSKELTKIIDGKLWLPGNDVLFISLEMPKDEIEDRVVSCMCGINSLDLMKGKLTASDEPAKLARAMHFWKNYPYNFKVVDVPRGCSMNQIQSIFDDVCLEFRPKIVIVDYLGLMTDSGESDADWEKLKNVAEQMHEFGRVNEVVTFTGVQVKCSKPGEGGVGLHRIGRSSMIMHNVNLALQIENRDNEGLRPDSIIHCIKFRRGPAFVMNNLRKEFQYCRFADSGLPDVNSEQEIGKPGEDLSSLMAAILPSEESEEESND